VVTRLVRAPRIDLSGLRQELELPDGFPPAALREAKAAADSVDAVLAGRTDHTGTPFVTIDPATSRDLDQAVFLERRDGGFRVHYAIADVAAFVAVDGALDAETWRRGETIYLPDGKVPLHPVSLSEGAASLLPGQTRPAVVWTIDLDRGGDPTSVRLERAVIRSRAMLDYDSVQQAAQAGTLAEPVALLPEIGTLLQDRALERGAIDLPIPEQELEPDDGGWRLVLRARLPVEAWNAQISLLTGRCAADIMLRGGVGLLRTMPPPAPPALATLRQVATALGVTWPAGTAVARVVADLDPARPNAAAFIDEAAELLRGSAYTTMDGAAPRQPLHGGVAAPYAHVTAPLRRLADRYATETCLHLAAGTPVPQWVRTALARLPEVMAASGRRAGAAERGAIDLAEAVLLHGSEGAEFDAVVLDVVAARDGRQPSATISIDEPPVRARCYGTAAPGERVRVRLMRADPAQRLVTFEIVRAAPKTGAESSVASG
jgi:exoribonuclease R